MALVGAYTQLALTTAWDSGARQSGTWSGSIQTTKTFTALEDGVRLTVDLVTDQQDPVTELWWTLPVYLRNPAQEVSTHTEIKCWDGSLWQTLETAAASTQWLRLSRDWGEGRKSVWLDLGTSRDVKLSSADYQQSYQNDGLFRNIMIDLHGNTGVAQSLPAAATYTVDVTTTDPGLTREAASVTVQKPSANAIMPAGETVAAKWTVDWVGQTPGDQFVEAWTGTGWILVIGSGSVVDVGSGTYQVAGGVTSL